MWALLPTNSGQGLVSSCRCVQLKGHRRLEAAPGLSGASPCDQIALGAARGSRGPGRAWQLLGFQRPPPDPSQLLIASAAAAQALRRGRAIAEALQRRPTLVPLPAAADAWPPTSACFAPPLPSLLAPQTWLQSSSVRLGASTRCVLEAVGGCRSGATRASPQRSNRPGFHWPPLWRPQVQVAPSGRAKCQACQGLIPKGELRLGVLIELEGYPDWWVGLGIVCGWVCVQS